MKKLLLIFAICCMLTSCTVSNIYYQMYQTKPITQNIEVVENKLKYEDDNCVVFYDFWKEYGDIGFVIYNKNTENIYLHLDECFYVANGVAYDYYQNRIYSNSSTAVIYSVLTLSDSYSTAEKKIICIPPQSSKRISEFSINTQLYIDCAVLQYPGKKDNAVINFTQEESPFTFGNRLAYTVGDSETIIRFKNDFYVSKISNYPIETITKEVTKEYCGKKIYGQPERVFINTSPDQFYIQYQYDYRYDNKPENQTYYERYY